MGHRISVARSKTLMGNYEPCPYNPIMRQMDEGQQSRDVVMESRSAHRTGSGIWYISAAG